MNGKSVHASVVGPTGAPQFAGGYAWFASPNQKYVFTLNPNGNLVLYRVAGASSPLAPGVSISAKYLWSTNTENYPGAFLVVQTDGNLVLYWNDQNAQPIAQPIWSWPNWTGGLSYANLYLLDNGTLVLYNGTNPVWTIAGPF